MTRAHQMKMAALAALVGVAGCTLEDPQQDAGLEGKAGSIALVQVDRWESPDQATPHLVAGAKVASFTGIEATTVEELLGGATLDADTCSLSSATRGNAAIGAEAEVALLDVGAIELEAGDLATLLEPRMFPAVGSTAAGVFYAAEGSVTVPRAEDDEYSLRARGVEGLGSFELVMPAPGTPTEVRVDGYLLDEDATISRDRDLELTWDAEDLSDVLELELSSGGEVLTCACRDDGHLSLSARYLRGLDAEEGATLVIRRVRHQQFDMTRVDAAHARVATARAFTVTIR